MKAKTKNTIITIIIILAIAILAFVVLSKKPAETDSEIVKCIGSKSILYVQLGCSHCKVQEEMFGDNLQYINKIDCWYERQSCIDNNITGTPTWIIKDQEYVGVQSIDKLKELTGC
jgi:hypothetical protein